MDSNGGVAVKTMVKDKDSHGSRCKNHQEGKQTGENFNPNVLHSSPSGKPSPSSSPVVVKSAKGQKSVTKKPKTNDVSVYSPQNKMKHRRFVVAKKNLKKDADSKGSCKCKEKGGAGCGGYGNKCLTVAYEYLRASQEEFFKNKGENEGKGDVDQGKAAETVVQEEEVERSLMIHDLQIHGVLAEGEAEKSAGLKGEEEKEYNEPSETESPNQIDSSTIKRRRDRLLEEARQSVPDNGSGRVMHLVKAFEKLLSIPKSKDSEMKEEEDDNKNNTEMKWALPGLQPPKAPESAQDSSSIPFCPLDLFLTSENLGLDSRLSVSTSWDGSRRSSSSRISTGSRRSRRNSTESSGTFGGRKWNKKQQLKVTSQKPFKLRTEQRGRLKEEEFMKKMEEMMQEEERQRIPIAQGLPWTTDEPECLIKPPVKESTRPVDVKLHSDIRAVDRAEFDHQVSEKMTLIELYKIERERQQKLAEEEEIRRLRKELVPKAQPMPYFDRPFIPRRSVKHPTIPKEPRFHIPQQKKIKCCLSWNDMSHLSYQH